MPTENSDEHKCAAIVAENAGKLLMVPRLSGLLTGKALGAVGDAISNTFITRIIRETYPDDGMLSEEDKDDELRLSRQRVWVIDPLDGTREYSEGRADWAVHVALVKDGVPAACAVSLPGLGQIFSTAHPPPITPAAPGRLHIVVSRTRPPEVAQKVAELLGGELVHMGSAGAKAMAVVRGEAHAYIHGGGQFEWDSAAPAGVAAAAGLHVSRLDGSPLRYNQPDPYLPDLIICRPELAADILKAVAAPE
ncbi:MAG TPA: 3'(2'),5'-bisphosphate nucleotidase CysQ [Candidatus Binataceae bacterium]|jgi:3'(2'), 5'-bisphosphate nucleotidase|nr:3'(2'),5'-bisphosphate nucleotidase CysQ [Candidatus Binataceae bacterium]